MGFAYCDFRNSGATQMMMARAVARPRSRRVEQSGSVDSARAEVSPRVLTPQVDSAKLEPVKSEPKADTKVESTPELRRSTE
jgi:hypothetical protein